MSEMYVFSVQQRWQYFMFSMTITAADYYLFKLHLFIFRLRAH